MMKSESEDEELTSFPWKKRTTVPDEGLVNLPGLLSWVWKNSRTLRRLCVPSTFSVIFPPVSSSRVTSTRLAVFKIQMCPGVEGK